jgi:phosphatidylserine/phosphatidylglycerophosphate/cardiolipin synthase-like enzyme
MHNKFAVFDYRDTSSESDDWVWTGSWNATDPGNGDDAQNSLEIQDQALAHAYTMEFNEMWGSDTDVPNANVSRFGVRKFDNTPHEFNVKGTTIELYFSPSDQTTLHIYRTLAASVNSINVCMYTFTRSDLAQELVEKKTAGEKVRVLMDNNTDTGNQYSFLQSNGVDLHLKGSDVTGYLHHKYALVDAEAPNADEVVITGSHNWSKSAETGNNENTLIVHDKRIVNLYLQEFKRRYLSAGGTDAITVGVIRTDDEIPRSTALSQNYPNPFNPTTNFQLRIAKFGFVSVKIFDLLGREIATLVNENRAPGVYTITWDASRLASGMYFCRLKAGNFALTKKVLLVR